MLRRSRQRPGKDTMDLDRVLRLGMASGLGLGLLLAHGGFAAAQTADNVTSDGSYVVADDDENPVVSGEGTDIVYGDVATGEQEPAMDLLCPPRSLRLPPRFDADHLPVDRHRAAVAQVECSGHGVDAVEDETQHRHRLVEARSRQPAVEVPRRPAVLSSGGELADDAGRGGAERQPQLRREGFGGFTHRPILRHRPVCTRMARCGLWPAAPGVVG